jgi:hypothetical protein
LVSTTLADEQPLAFNEFAGTRELFASKYILADNKAWALVFESY